LPDLVALARISFYTTAAVTMAIVIGTTTIASRQNRVVAAD
jgi:hypothetical protein